LKARTPTAAARLLIFVPATNREKNSKELVSNNGVESSIRRKMADLRRGLTEELEEKEASGIGEGRVVPS